MTAVYKLLDAGEWAQARAVGVFAGSAVDLADGYIHLSTAKQAPQTARLHFSGHEGLVLLRIEAEALGEALRWEPSRGGDLFPHLYGPLAADLATEVRALALDASGAPILGDLAP